MRTEDRIWALVAKRLADEATIKELQELDGLLKRNPGIDRQVKIIAGWWHQDIQEEIASRGARIFEKIKEKIKAAEDQSNHGKSRLLK